MPRKQRIAIGGLPYHVLNRASQGRLLFPAETDYRDFVGFMTRAKERFPIRIYSFCLMPNHWHLVLYPEHDGTLIQCIHWLTGKHAQRYHINNQTTGRGHVYQGRYQSFPITTDEHFLQVCRYVERNPLNAGLVRKAENWRWSSLSVRMSGNVDHALIDNWPVKPDGDYLSWINSPQPKEEGPGPKNKWEVDEAVPLARGKEKSGKRWC